MKTSILLEQVYSTAPKVDRESGVIRDVKVIGFASKNRRQYKREAIERAIPLYEGVEINVDHPEKKEHAARERKMAEGFGTLRNVRMGDDGAYADLHYLKSHPLAEMIVERAERFPNSFGLSHNARGQSTILREGKELVESIERVFSVDIVRRPATTRGLFESEEGTPKMKIREYLESVQSESQEAKRLVEMMDDMPEMADVAMPDVGEEPAGDVESQVKAAMEALVVAVLQDDSLDKQGKIAKIRDILAAEEKLTDSGGAPDAGSDSGDSGGDSGSSGEDTMAESIRELRDGLARIERRETVRALLEAAGMSLAAITPARRKLLDAERDEAKLEALIESWREDEERSGLPRRAGARPAVRSILESHDADGSYEELKKRIRPKVAKR